MGDAPRGDIPFDPKGSCLFFDVDGTLIDIAAHPDEVVVPASLLEDLHALNRRLDGALALCSGRTIGALDRLFRPLVLAAAGAHGAEFRFTPGSATISGVEGDLPSALLDGVADIARSVPGLLVEDKKVCIAVHYRDNPEAGPDLRLRLENVAAGLPGLGLVVMPGHFVFELKRASHDKGTALDAFMAQPAFAGRQPIFLGDDITDEKAFMRVGAYGGLAISVAHPRQGAVQLFDTPSQVRAWLSALAAQARQPA